MYNKQSAALSAYELVNCGAGVILPAVE